MEKLEYIPGDLVRIKTEPNNLTPNKIVYKFVVYVAIDNVLLKTINGIYRLVGKDRIVPIPLTSEIIEKNGWKLSHGFYWSPNEEGAGIGLSSQTGYVWEAYLGRQPLRSNINSVSDLQHLLFGIGLNSEMEV